MRKPNHFSTLRAWAVAALSAVLMAACGGSDTNPGTGTLGVSLTDAPACGFDAVNVTVSKVRVHSSSSAGEGDVGWIDIPVNRKVNLLHLSNGVLDKLGQAPLAAGHYTQVRLVLDPNSALGLANSVVPAGGTETALVTPSAVQSGIKLVHEFDVVAGQRADLVLDFDACTSIVRRGNGTFALKPVIQAIPSVLNGINGFVSPSLLGEGVVVSAQQNGVVVRATVPHAVTGEFFLARLPAGDYDVVLTASGRTTALIATVPVVSTTSVTLVSSSAAPIMLPASAVNTVSGTATLNPTSTTELAFVAARQTLGVTGPVATVKWVAADSSSLPAGAYAMPLPTAAPLLGAYSPVLPIALVAQTGKEGKYTLQATASGYQTQTADVDISAAGTTQSFTLVP